MRPLATEPCRHEWSKLMEGNIMSSEAWSLSMARRARCIRCGSTLQGFEAAQAVKAQSDRIATALAKDKVAAGRAGQ